MSRILIVDDDKALARSLEIHLADRSHEVRTAHTLARAASMLDDDPDDIVFLDLKLPDGDSRGFLETIRKHHPRIRVIMITGHQDMQATIEAIRLGAFDYIRKPLDLDQVLAALAKAETQLRAKPAEGVEPVLPPGASRPRELVGRSPGILEVLKQIAVLSESRVTVLVQGETGTGKELVARALHEASGPRGPFVAVNCGGVVSTLLESELFGHEKGAFTGAVGRKIGKLELAAEGTVFFDEIGDMSLDLQSKLLRALQEEEFERVGGTEAVTLRARVIAATHRDLDAMVKTGTFREDLFFRLAVARLRVPPLRERMEDLPLLAEYLLGRIAERLGKPAARLTREGLQMLGTHAWPGNVRQLENVLTRAVAQRRGEVLDAADLVVEEAPADEYAALPISGDVLPLRELERRYVLHALNRMDWNITRTAGALEISPTTLRKKITDHGLERGGGSPDPDR